MLLELQAWERCGLPETQSLGMQGLGVIYEKYRDGELEDDDEVALIHGPAEMNFLPLSLAMVNVRATLSHAVDCGVVQKEDADHILKLAKSLFLQISHMGTALCLRWTIEVEEPRKTAPLARR